MWVNARYYRAFVVPPGCPDQQQLQAFADPEALPCPLRTRLMVRKCAQEMLSMRSLLRTGSVPIGYYRAFVVPPGCPDQQQLQAFADPEQSLHIHNMHSPVHSGPV
jgi:hypothetical protein